MGSEPDEVSERIQSEIRVLGLKREVSDVTGLELTGIESPDTPPYVSEQFWTNLLEYEKAELTTNAEELRKDGVDLRSPSSIPDWQMHDALWSLINELASRGIYLEDTDHLSDRELYEFLFARGLHERVKNLDASTGWSYHLSPIGSGSEEDMLIYHRYYATPRTRRSWMADFPDYKMPRRVKRPFDRDRHLPKWDPTPVHFPGDEPFDD